MRLLLTVAASMTIAYAQAPAPAGKMAEEVYKNIVELKSVPADQVGPAMQFISSSLGVDCNFCHVQGKMEADDKGAKKTAREMMHMQAEINKTSFRGQKQVTCYSCHRGSVRPVNAPPVQESDAAPARPAGVAMTPPAQGQTVTADQILEKYVTALGGPDALRKITSRAQTGKILVGGSESPIEVLTKAPNRRVAITHGANGDSFTAFDGTAGWMGNAGRPAREMSASESMASAVDAEFSLALRVKELYPQIRRGRPEEIGGVACEVLNASGPGRMPVRMYFDTKTGLLTRIVRYADTPLGRIPTQVDYADYREQDGVKTPFRWTLSRVNGRFTIQIAELKNNAAIEDAKFVRPAGDGK